MMYHELFYFVSISYWSKFADPNVCRNQGIGWSVKLPYMVTGTASHVT